MSPEESVLDQMNRERRKNNNSSQNKAQKDNPPWERLRKKNAHHNNGVGQKSEMFSKNKKKNITCLAKANYHFMRIIEMLSDEENSTLIEVITPDREKVIDTIREELIQKIEEGS
jgi:hypothetical protein